MSGNEDVTPAARAWLPDFLQGFLLCHEDYVRRHTVIYCDIRIKWRFMCCTGKSQWIESVSSVSAPNRKPRVMSWCPIMRAGKMKGPKCFHGELNLPQKRGALSVVRIPVSACSLSRWWWGNPVTKGIDKSERPRSLKEVFIWYSSIP